MAMAGGRARGRRNRPPAAATSERLTSGTPNRAAVEATTRSQASTISVPPARAGPSTAAIIGLVRARRAMPPNPPRLVMIDGAFPAAMAFRSAPAENTDPSPVRMPTQTSGSSSSRSMADSMPWATSSLTALRASGRRIVITATGPSTS